MSAPLPSSGHDPLGRGMPPGTAFFPSDKSTTASQTRKHVLPTRSIVSQKKRRLAAFRLPINYLLDQCIGYQRDADKFTIYRIKSGALPEGFQLVWIQFDMTKQEAYVCIEHESFPEYKAGTICQEIPIELEELEVVRADSLSTATPVAESPKPDAPPKAGFIEFSMPESVAGKPGKMRPIARIEYPDGPSGMGHYAPTSEPPLKETLADLFRLVADHIEKR